MWRLGYPRSIELVAAARVEVVGLHEFFVGWLTGTLDARDARFTEAAHPDFSMIVPSGETLDRDAVVASLREAHGTAEAAFRIEIRDVVDRAAGEDAVLVTYEEWQLVGARLVSRRTSTAYFLRDAGAPSGVLWRRLAASCRRYRVRLRGAEGCVGGRDLATEPGRAVRGSIGSGA